MRIEEQQAQVRALGAELRALRAEPYTEGGKAIWVDCPACGTVPPRTVLREVGRWESTIRPVAINAPVASRASHRWLICSGCGKPLPARSVALKTASRADTKCDLRCLNAKGDDCNCPCDGLCHGRGTCSCTKEEEND